MLLYEKIIQIFLILVRLTAGAEKLAKIEFETNDKELFSPNEQIIYV